MNKTDIQNILIFLSRTTLKGEEAMTLADLQVKLSKMLETMSEEIVEKKGK